VPGSTGTNGHASPVRGRQAPTTGAPSPARAAAAFRTFLESLGLDPDDPILEGTDQRVARAYHELLAGLAEGAEPKLTVFPNTEGHSGIVQVSGIPF
jgi:GTP cyclohydrolase I